MSSYEPCRPPPWRWSPNLLRQLDRPCLSWFSRSGFWCSDSYAFFITRGRLNNFINACVSGGSPFRHFFHAMFEYIFPLCMVCDLVRLFLVSSLGFCFSVVGFHSPFLGYFSSSLASLGIGASYILAGGCASGALGMCLSVSCDFGLRLCSLLWCFDR
ncbi:hypothetical protein IGI04_034612, partial [Brassica rapa subsp. trilocularis]